MLQALLLAHHDVAILPQEGAHIRPQQRLQRLQPRHRPVDRVIDLALAVGKRRHRRQIDQRVAAGADVLDAHAGQLEGDLGLGRAAQETIGVGVARRAMAQHGEAEGRRAERLLLGVDRRARAPPPGAMDERPMRRVHQADHRVVDGRGKRYALEDVGRTLADIGQQRHRRRGVGIVAEIDPDVALPLERRIALHLDAGDVELLLRHQRRNGGAAPAAVEAPAVIAALDLAAVEAAAAQRNAAMRADVSEREGRAVIAAAEQQRLAEQRLRHHAPAPERRARQGEIPHLPQRRGAVHIHAGGDISGGASGAEGRSGEARRRSVSFYPHLPGA
jgi:hypothetical protein